MTMQFRPSSRLQKWNSIPHPPAIRKHGNNQAYNSFLPTEIAAQSSKPTRERGRHMVDNTVAHELCSSYGTHQGADLPWLRSHQYQICK